MIHPSTVSLFLLWYQAQRMYSNWPSKSWTNSTKLLSSHVLFLSGVCLLEEGNNEWAMLNNPSGISLIVELQATQHQMRTFMSRGLFGSPLIMPHQYVTLLLRSWECWARKGLLYSGDGPFLLSAFSWASLSYSICICFLWPNSKLAVAPSPKEPESS